MGLLRMPKRSCVSKHWPSIAIYRVLRFARLSRCVWIGFEVSLRIARIEDCKE